MVREPPPGYQARPMRLDDAGLIAEHSARYTSALLGFAKHSAADVANYLRDPGFDPTTDGWVVFGPDQQFAGSATAMVFRDRVNCEILGEDRQLVEWLLDRCLERAGEVPDEATVTVGVLAGDDFLAPIVAGRGFSIGTRIHRMRVDHPAGLVAPAPPAGVQARSGAEDERVRRAAYAVLVEAFATQSGAQARPYDEWVASRESRSTFDWSQLVVLELAGRPVAMRECNDNFVATDNCGYIGRLAVRPDARGRGLAKYLLRDAFAVDAAAGRTGTMLHVDESNPTRALGLYTSVGMRADITSVVWRRKYRGIPRIGG